MVIRWRTERWGTFERRLDVRDVEDSGSSFFVTFGRLLREGGTEGQISMIQGRIRK